MDNFSDSIGFEPAASGSAPAQAPGPGQKPREPRRRIFVKTRMAADGPYRPATVLNMSSHGMLVCATPAPPRGTYVEFVFGETAVIARVMWRQGTRFGVRTRERIDAAMLAGKPSEVVQLRSGNASMEVRMRRAVQLGADSRLWARVAQFAVIAGVTMVAIVALGAKTFEILSEMASAVGGALGG